MGIFHTLFGKGNKAERLKEFIEKKAVIIDVRTKGEFQSGHIKGSINIPLDQLPNGMSKLKKDVPVITCCASGMRSAAAKNILSKHGYTVENGGGWGSLSKRLK